nr:metallophosphoesterase [Cyclobacteriaceae bacterium]
MNFKHVSGALSILISCALFTQCAEKKETIFRHDIASGNTPWSAKPAGKPATQFTFAVIGDLNSGERAGVLEVAVEQLNLLRPEFILSIGDLVEGGTVDTLQLKKEYEHFDERVGK